MDLFMKLWLAIGLSAFATWVWSFLAWTMLPLHRKDWSKLPDEDGVMKAIRDLKISPGVYIFPSMDHSCKDPAIKAKWEAGPMGLLNVWRPKPNMIANLLATLGVMLSVSILVGYLASAAIPAGASFGRVMQVTGTAGILGYTFAFLPNMIWFQASTRAKITFVLDGIIMGLITGAVIAAMWPKA